MGAPDAASAPWATRRRRAEVLRGRYPFAAELLAVYLALLDVWEDGWDLAREERPEPRALAHWAGTRILPRVVKATGAAGPEPLAAAARELFGTGAVEESLAGWLAGVELAPVERYLARASLYAPLAALDGDAAVACAGDPAPRDERHCPCCGGAPQLSFRSAAEDRLVTGRRQLACARCGQAWAYTGSACPWCGETTGSRRTVYAEQRNGPVVGREDPGPTAVADAEAPTFPHLRVDACASCERYLIDVDLGRDPRAVPEVDELAALPLDLYATERGLSKITPNLMGF
jgi:FdhE protein